jgi:uncharacterized protein (TIGR00730 family)
MAARQAKSRTKKARAKSEASSAKSKKQKPPPMHAPLAPYKDPAFLDSTAARPIRILTEYLHPLVQLKKEGIGDTIVMFGSARIESRESALARLGKLKSKAALKRVTAQRAAALRAAYRQPLRDARSALEMSRYYEQARELSRRITKWAMTLGERPRRFVVCSGGGPGIMEAANRGAMEAGGKSIGLSIELPHEQFANPYISPELSLNFHYFFMRKLWFAQIAKALIVFPGGFGTMDELWEMLTLLQTGKLPKNSLIIIYGRKYWDQVLNFRAIMRWGMISPTEYKMLQFADTVDEAFDRIKSGLEKYHMELDSDL